MGECAEKSSAHVSSHGINVRLAVGGMTCVACSRAITDALSELEGVSDISVNQVGKSASAVVTAADLVESITTVIEDIGYECKVISATPVMAVGTLQPGRTVALEFKGMESLSVSSYFVILNFTKDFRQAKKNQIYIRGGVRTQRNHPKALFQRSS